jgi:hypothetical protein
MFIGDRRMSPQQIMYGIRIAAALIELLKDKDVTRDDVLHVAEGLGIDIPTTEEDNNALEIVIEAITGIFK